ncbi:flagellar assembly protein FliH [Halobacillus fulvus]|nr:flagellar assembly protein FliH [Halobacillus fulvus]
MTSLSKQFVQIKPIYVPEQPKEIPQDEVQPEQLIREAEEKLIAAEKQAALLIDQAEQTIADEREKWEAERTLLSEQAQEQGFREGFQQGKREGQDSYQAKLDLANHLIEEAEQTKKSIIDSSTADMMEIALASAEKIIGQTLKDDPEAFINVVKTALKEVQDQIHITIYVHPEQYKTVLDQREELMMIAKPDADLAIHIRQNVPLHSCTIESPFGQLEAGVDDQLLELRQKLFELVQEDGDHE